MTKAISFFWLGVLCMVTGCATLGTTVVESGAQPGLKFDQYSSRWTLGGEPINTGSLWGGVLTGINSKAWLQGTFDKGGGNQTVELYVEFSGKGAGQLIAVSASDSSGTSLRARRVQNTMTTSVLGRTYFAPKELVAVTIPNNYLGEHTSSGLDIQLRGYNNMTAVVKIPADYVRKFSDDFNVAFAQQRK